jgi:hypothetical protein
MSYEITIERRGMMQTNHNEYLVRLTQAPPEIEIHFLNTENPRARRENQHCRQFCRRCTTRFSGVAGKRILFLPLTKNGER